MQNFRKNNVLSEMLIWLKNFKRLFLTVNPKKYYSQDGEDIILGNYLLEKKNGFYVDVGAHHPKRFSNTYLFYKKGWNGINIDSLPGSMKAFRLIRKRDINLEIGISRDGGDLTYYMFNEPALNGFSENLSIEREKEGVYRIVDKKVIKTYRLSEILDKYLPKGIEIDFLSIDVEGLDLEVLESNNWERFIPKYILIECRGSSVEDVFKDSVYEFLKQKEYKLVAKTFRTCIFERKI